MSAEKDMVYRIYLTFKDKVEAQRKIALSHCPVATNLIIILFLLCIGLWFIPHFWFVWKILLHIGIPVACCIVSSVIERHKHKEQYRAENEALKRAETVLQEYYNAHKAYLDNILSEIQAEKVRAEIEEKRHQERINRIMGKMNDAALRTAYPSSSSSSYSSSTDSGTKTESERRWRDDSGRDGGYIDSQGVMRDNVGRETGLRVDHNDRVYNEKSEAVGHFDSNGDYHSF